MNKFKLVLIALASSALIACGSSSSSSSASYKGKTDPASFSGLSAEAQQSIGTDSSEAISGALESSEFDNFDFPLGVQVEDKDSSININKLAKDKLKSFKKNSQRLDLTHIPTAAKISETLDCDSGSMHISGSMDEDTLYGDFTITYKNCFEDWGYGDYQKTNGKEQYKISKNKIHFNLDITYENRWDGEEESGKIKGFMKIEGIDIGSIDEDDIDGALDLGTYTITWDLSGHENGEQFASVGEVKCKNGVCALSSTVKLSNGKTFKLADVKYEYTDNDYAHATGTIYHPDYGHYTFDASIRYSCDIDYGDKSPFVGEAVYKDADGKTISYESLDCEDEPTITSN